LNSEPRRERTLGLVFAASGMITWGLVPVFAHRFANQMDPLLFGGLSSVVGAAPLVGYLARLAEQRDLGIRRFARPLAGIALLGMWATLLLFYGTTLTSGINTGLLLQLEPVYSVAVSALWLGEAIPTSQLGATAVMVAGAAAVLFRGPSSFNLGDAFIAASPLFTQLSHVISKKIIREVSDASLIPAARLLFGGVGLTGIALAVHPESVRQLLILGNLVSIAAFGLIFRSLDLFLWYEALRRIPLSRASAVLPLSVAVSFLGALAILGEKVRTSQLVGLALILAGMAWLSSLHLGEKVDVAI
jgi:drug/metabolite transporter (DMT)-like permease